MLVLAVSAICTWLVLSGMLLVLILIAKSMERQEYQSLLNEHGECQGCYMLRSHNMCTNPECRHYVKYSPPTPEEREYNCSIYDPWCYKSMRDMLNDELPKIEPKEDDDPGHTLYQ